MSLTLGLSWSWVVLIITLVGYISYSLYRYFKTKKILTTLTEEEFRKGYRKAQLIDVREQKEYDVGYILGARNIPVSQLKRRKNELRKDLPVYLYCQNEMRTQRAAAILEKEGFKMLYQLEGGFKKWTGNIKKTKSTEY